MKKDRAACINRVFRTYISIRLQSKKQAVSPFFLGYDAAPVKRVRLTNIRMDTVERVSVVKHVDDFIVQNLVVNGERLQAGDLANPENHASIAHCTSPVESLRLIRCRVQK